MNPTNYSSSGASDSHVLPMVPAYIRSLVKERISLREYNLKSEKKK